MYAGKFCNALKEMRQCQTLFFIPIFILHFDFNLNDVLFAYIVHMTNQEDQTGTVWI